MVEYFTQAIVLDKEDLNETDSLVYFYTEELGRVTARARGLKKLLSKSNAHLEPLNLVEVRFIAGRNGRLQLVDALSFNYATYHTLKEKIKSSPEELFKLLKVLQFIKEMTFDFHKDLHLWHALNKVINLKTEEKVIYQLFLKILGFDPKYAVCGICHNNNPVRFYIKEHIFLCGNCASKGGENEVIFI